MIYTLQEHRDGDWITRGTGAPLEQYVWGMVVLDGDDARPRRITRDGTPILYGRHPVVHEEVEPDWRPIEMAPRDGTDVLLSGFAFDDPTRGHWQAVGSFSSKTGKWHQEDPEDADPDLYLYDPTHWQPLPPPPQNAEAVEF